MPHFIDTYAGVAKPWWWGLEGTADLGVMLDAAPTGADMLKAARLDWRVRKQAVTYTNRVTGNVEALPDAFAICRDDTGEALSGVTVGRIYEPFQNADLFALGDDLARTGECRWHTAGSLFDGRRVWGLAQVAGNFELKRHGEKHVTAPFLLLYNTHDGSSRIKAKFVATEVVCWNTCSAALGERTNEYKFRHTKSAAKKADEIAEALGLARSWHAEYHRFAKDLVATPMSRDEFQDFAARILVLTAESIEEARETIARSEGRRRANFDELGGRLTKLFESGRGNHGRDRFDALNAVTEFVDYQHNRLHRARNARRGLDSMWFGAGARLKKHAVRLLSR